jgi:hypothetical protein
LLKRANHQARADEQHHGQGHLRRTRTPRARSRSGLSLVERPPPRNPAARGGPEYRTTGITPNSSAENGDTLLHQLASAAARCIQDHFWSQCSHEECQSIGIESEAERLSC